MLIGVLAAASQATASGSGAHTCTLPFVKAETVDVEYAVAPSAAGDAIAITAHYAGRGETPILMPLIGAATFSGTAEVQLRVTRPDGSTQSIGARLTIPRTDAPQDPYSPAVPFDASGATSPIDITSAGFSDVAVTLLALNLTAFDANGNPVDGLGSITDSDADPMSFDVPCADVDAPVSAGALTLPAGLSPAVTSAEYTCSWPVIGAQPATITASLDLPDSVPPGDFTPVANYRLSIAMRGNAWTELAKRSFGAFAGLVTSDQEIVWGQNRLTLRAPLTLPSTTLPLTNPGTGGFVLPAAGTLPRILLPTSDATTWFEQRLLMSLRPTGVGGAVLANLGASTDSDKRPETFDVPCVPDTGTRLLRRYALTTSSPASPTPAPTASPSPTPAPVPSSTPAPTAAPLSGSSSPEDAPTRSALPGSPVAPQPGPAPAPTPSPTPPTEIVVDHRVLRFRGLLIALRYAATCPRRATIVIFARDEGRTVKMRRHVRVRRATRGCTVSGAIRLTAELASQRAVHVRVTGAGLSTTTRRLPLY